MKQKNGRIYLCTLLGALSCALGSCSKAKNTSFAKKESPSWMKQQIQGDLAPFAKEGIRKTDLDQCMEQYGAVYQIARFRIRNQEVEVVLPSQAFIDPSRVHDITRAFAKLSKKVKLPNVDFLISMGDSLDRVQLTVPIFTFARTESNAVLFPDFEILSKNEKLQQTLEGNSLYPWNQKISQAMWRGAMTGGIFTPQNFLNYPRSKAITASLQFPLLINARFVGLVQCEDCAEIERLYPQYFAESMGIAPQIAYKYQLLIDGNSCAYSRAYWQLFSNCVTFKQESPAVQWYYADLKPYVHYIPLQNDLSDLVEKLQWAQDHDKEALQISHQAQEFAKEHLSRESVLQYVYLLLKEYAALQR